MWSKKAMETIDNLVSWPFRRVKDGVQCSEQQQIMLSIEIQQAVNIARTRDMLQW